MIRDTTDIITSVSYLDVLLLIGRNGRLSTPLYDKRDDFNIHIPHQEKQQPIFARLWRFYPGVVPPMFYSVGGVTVE